MIARIVIAVALATGIASADEPWKQGVTPEKQAAAQKLLDEGNNLFVERDYAGAIAKYQQALAVWDHPSIRFNMVRTLIQMDRVVEAYDNLELALKYGAAPLEENVYSEALAYQKLLAKQIANVVVACDQKDVHVTFDGQPLLHCPGKQTRRVLPGQHQVVGKRAGYLTRTVEVVVLGGKNEDVSLKLEPLGQVGTITHRWKLWIPWAVVGAGAGVVGLGAIAQALAVNDHDRYYDRVARECAPAGCDAGFAADLQDQAIIENRVAIGLFTVGAAALITGGIMVYMNRGRPSYPHDAVSLTPTRDGATLTVRGSF